MLKLGYFSCVCVRYLIQSLQYEPWTFFNTPILYFSLFFLIFSHIRRFKIYALLCFDSPSCLSIDFGLNFLNPDHKSLHIEMVIMNGALSLTPCSFLSWYLSMRHKTIGTVDSCMSSLFLPLWLFLHKRLVLLTVKINFLLKIKQGLFLVIRELLKMFVYFTYLLIYYRLQLLGS